VSLQEPETSTYLTLDQQKPGLTERANVIMSNSLQLSFTVSDCNVGTNLLWMMEREDMFTGGLLLNKATRVALRDLNTGLYMRTDGEGLIATPNRSECTFFDIFASQQMETGAIIQDSTAIQLRTQNKWLAVGGKTASGGTKSNVATSSDRANALSVVVSCKTQRSLNSDLFVGVEAAGILRQFEAQVRSKKLFELSYGLLEMEFKTIFGCLDHLSDFLSPSREIPQDIIDNEVAAALEPVGAATVVIRQTMLREQGILQVLLDIIEMCALGMLRDVDDARFKSLTPASSRDEFKDSALFATNPDDMFDSGAPMVGKSKTRASISAHKKNMIRLSLVSKVKGMKAVPRQSVADVVMAAIRAKKGQAQGQPEAHNITDSPKQDHKRKAGSLMYQPSSGDIAGSQKKSAAEKKQSLVHDLARGCLHVLYMAILKNHVSQICIADYFPLLLNQVKDQELAVSVVQEILKDNLQMLQTKVCA
jgi:hypothetical protein